ncbi:anhydro-N-acetylmuramic acid kinase [Candidatus Brocadia sapporoensis]|uniref:Anhydro-N-acetylmuramic acid kinase n=1 Tax=Candidatus Brocadia sapporoensis TaxID=392547 RepID=A0A1V6M346_9BACT|nr:anhydro-N-acetylmuramic acid kinase [Candidatus Brocadia sapporoensis]MDG6004637.1 anhydro-N-acetylmuramic acid kinase [Candidatus Brocadia sp.]OQD46834.1 anhydro-N-acetylmuramic acid kinase [Candidatus Brocadia sapporoensis]GJQ23804.1 MAG: anhydro-N-acetylmuramic acid kinase [Candidatus Brocadia sapporoensis]
MAGTLANKILQIQQKNPKKVIGLMSGTSADGIDACLVEISGNGIHTKIHILDFETYPYDNATRTAIFETCNLTTGTVDKVCYLNFYLGKLFANAAKSLVKKTSASLADIDFIGSHGQTIYHLPDKAIIDTTRDLKKDLWGLPFLPSTLQIGEPSVIAQETGITTVADFRPRDVAAGGQGAPLVPYADFILFRDKEKGRALQNIGGIANVTFLPSNCSIDEIVAFDTGPGNMVIDHITQIVSNNRHHFDDGGKLAARGKVNDRLLASLLAHPYISKPPPKSTGREEFGKPFADNLYKNAVLSGIEDMDILATATAFTARTIADSYKQWILTKHHISEIIISGGGIHNATLIKFLIHYLPSTMKIYPISDFGIASNAKEALAFAILANETISGNPNNIPSVTGAKEAVIMGKITL